MLLPSHVDALQLPSFASFTGTHRHLLSSLHLLCGILHGLDDIHITCAAAQITRDADTNLVLTGVRVALQKRQPGHHHPWCAIPTLQAMLLVETFLQRM